MADGSHLQVGRLLGERLEQALEIDYHYASFLIEDVLYAAGLEERAALPGEGSRWRWLRQYVLRRADNRCQLCNARPLSLDIHHRTYDDPRGDEDPNDLIALCRRCHMMFHSHGELA